MTTYTRSGIPVIVLADSDKLFRGVYVDESVDTLLAYIKADVKLSFKQEMEAVIKATQIWVETGGLFKAVLANPAKLSPNARSFILETAGLLSGRLKQRRVGWPDWRLLLCSSESVVILEPKWSAVELEELRKLQLTPTPVLIQRWVSEYGVGDLVQTLGVFVSPSI